MESAGLRSRTQASGSDSGAKSKEEHQDTDVPKYTIDLSLPPAKRYQELARAFKTELATLPILFDEVVESLHPKLPLNAVRRLARFLLRHVHDKEQTEELRGIQVVTGIEMYLLVAFNVLLDLVMGCTSGKG